MESETKMKNGVNVKKKNKKRDCALQFKESIPDLPFSDL